MQVVPIELRTENAHDAYDLYHHLECGNILLLNTTPFLPAEEDALFLRARRQSSRGTHKNIAYKPHKQRITGAQETTENDAARLKSILAEYSRGALAFLSALLPAYARTWQVDYASFRPAEEAGRALPLRHRNDLMHIDAFPTRPTHGGRILRAFTNFHPTRPRTWATAAPFEELAECYAIAAGLHRVTGPWATLRRGGGSLARQMGLNVLDRSPYDEFMLNFHHYLKANRAFQETGRCNILAFPPGATWISFTDQVAHAVISGQYALEQTCIVPYRALLNPERAPVSILERLAGRRLIAPQAVPVVMPEPPARAPS